MYSVKKLIRDTIQQFGPDSIMAFIDMHGHSRKKNVFMYGPEFPIHDNRYLETRVLPKLMSENHEMFRFYSCRFRVTPDKETTARVVLCNEYNITNCFTLEASFHGFFNSERITTDFMLNHYMQVGDILSMSFLEFVIMLEDDPKYTRNKMK